MVPAPPPPPAFEAKDFLAFERHKWSDPDCNPERLRLKRKLQAMGEPLRRRLASGGDDLTLRTSIHNPFTFNGHRVDSLWLYLAPGDKAKRPIRQLLGVEFASDTDASYVHANLVLEIDGQGVNLGLRVHERAWWDVTNLKGRCSTREGAEEFAQACNEVRGDYALLLHDWPNRRPCATIRWDEVLEFFRYCEPGRHRVRVWRSLRRDDPAVLDPALIETAGAEFESLLPLYRLALWSPENDFLRLGKGSR